MSITNFQSLPKFMSIELVMPTSHLILCCPLFLLPPIPPSIRVFSNESTLCMSGQSIGVSASASFLPKKSQGWSPSEWTGWISLLSKGLSRVFSNTTVQKHQAPTCHGATKTQWSQINKSYKKKKKMSMPAWGAMSANQNLTLVL